LAKRAGYWLVASDTPGLVRVRGDVLELGPGAEDAEVACVAARRQLGLLADEAEVRDFANAYGYEYVPRRAACSTRLLPLDVATA
jgi:hypothetical protein